MVEKEGNLHIGSAILHRWFATVVICCEMASPMTDMLSMKKSRSPARISRSAGGIWPLSCAVMSSITECSSGGRIALFEGRSESVVSRMLDVWRFVRAILRFCGMLVVFCIGVCSISKTELAVVVDGMD